MPSPRRESDKIHIRRCCAGMSSIMGSDTVQNIHHNPSHQTYQRMCITSSVLLGRITVEHTRHQSMCACRLDSLFWRWHDFEQPLAISRLIWSIIRIYLNPCIINRSLWTQPMWPMCAPCYDKIMAHSTAHSGHVQWCGDYTGGEKSLYHIFFFINLVRIFWLEGLARTETPLSRACCVGPVLYLPIAQFRVYGRI